MPFSNEQIARITPIEKLAESVGLDFDCYLREGSWLDFRVYDVNLNCLYMGESDREATAAIKNYINNSKAISSHTIRKAMSVVQKDLFLVD